MLLNDLVNNEKEARQAISIIKRYRMNKQCFAGRPGSSMEYYLANGKAPTVSFRGEDSVTLNPANIEVKKVCGRRKIAEDTHWIMDFVAKEDKARMTYNIIKKYVFNRISLVGCLGPSMTYFHR